MNIINKGFLKLVLLPGPIYRGMDVNTEHLRSILAVKLTMDDRRVSAIQQARRSNKSKPVSMATVGTIFLSALMGVFFVLFLSVGADIITGLTFYFSGFFFMLSMSLIADFTSVLIDVRDNYIILPKPVNDRTILLARMLHIFIHICRIVLPMVLPGMIYIINRYNIAGGLLLLLVTLFLTLFSIFIINAVYIVILRITTPQRFQNVINYIQIIFAIAVYGAYQILPRFMSLMDARSFTMTDKSWSIFYPPYWFANSWDLSYNLRGNNMEIISGILGMIIPLLSLFIVVKYLAPSFNNKLALISSSAGAPSKPSVSAKTGRRTGYVELLSRVMTKTPAEKMGFLFTWKMASRSRDFKLKVYPSIGYLFVYVVIMFMQSKHLSLSQIRDQGIQGKVIVISALYISSLLLTMALSQSIYSEKYKAAWIYYVSPLQYPGEVILGGAKAAIFKFYIPVVAIIMVAGLFLVGPSILPNIILGLFNELLIATILVYLGNKMFPFSMHQNTNMRSGAFLRNLGVLVISGVIAVGHFLIYDIVAAVLLCVLLSVLATWLMMSAVKNVSWEQVRSSYEE